jgi:hypothetical protein
VVRTTLTALALATTTLATAACGTERTTTAGARAAAVPSSPEQVRADTLAGVAKRIYHQEAGGEVGHAAVKRIARDRALLAALRTQDAPRLRAAALRQLFNPGKHVVRLSVRHGTSTLVNVGGTFVVSPAQRALPAGLGVLEASMQDVIGYVKLVHRLSGAQIVVRGAAGHVESSLPSATNATLPASGQVTLAGRSYVVRSFPERGYDGEPLTVWVLT